MSTPVTTQSFQADMLDEISGAMAELGTSKAILFTNPITPSGTTVLADLTEATFTGYAAVATGTWKPSGIDPDGNLSVQAPTLQFMATDTDVQETVYGAAITNTGKTELFAVEVFDQPIPMGVNLLNKVDFDPRVVYGS